MKVSIALDELLAWNEEAAEFWHEHFAAHPELLALPCDIGGTRTVQEFVRHIWAVELRWAERISGQTETPREQIAEGPLDALFDLHRKAMSILRGVLANPAQDWEATYTLNVSWLPPEFRTATYRKLCAHALFHSQRHWAQLATLVRSAGHPSGFRGDLLFSPSFR
jgi:uncharacterized damage-inducible protein DinB